ncbi:hypothetical protein [Planifilum fimeticola]|nr:hypothetical protein [Planifilum fimeticola]
MKIRLRLAALRPSREGKRPLAGFSVDRPGKSMIYWLAQRILMKHT